jgi:hypothetical protein
MMKNHPALLSAAWMLLATGCATHTTPGPIIAAAPAPTPRPTPVPIVARPTPTPDPYAPMPIPQKPASSISPLVHGADTPLYQRQ